MASQDRLVQVRDLVNQWLPLVGHSVDVGPNIVDMIADDSSVETLYDFGNWMNLHGQAGILGGVDYGTYPWARWGMTSTDYHSRLIGYMTTFASLTGDSHPPPGFLERALQQDQGTMTSGDFRNWIVTQQDFLNMYGWVRYGLDWSQFQQQKLQMKSQFGRDLSNEEAVTQLQYLHAAQGREVAVAPQITLTQAEKKTVQAGVGGSVVR